MGYLTSANRQIKRGLLIQALREKAVSFQLLHGKPLDVVNIRCMLCGVVVHPEAAHLHEIVRRGLISNKSLLNYLPVELHALLCPDCNMNYADRRVDVLLGRSIGLWGLERVLEAVQTFNNKLTEAGGFILSPAIFPYYVLEEKPDGLQTSDSGPGTSVP